MNVITRGVRNAFRNTMRTLSIVVIVGLSIALSLAMLIAHQAVGQKINSVKASVGNTVTISPAGVRGFEGGGNPLTTTQIAKVKTLPHVVTVDESLSDRLTSSDTSLQSAIDAGQLGQRFAQRTGLDQGFAGRTVTNFTPPIMITGTTSPTNLKNTQGGGSFTLKSGTVFASNSSDKVALIGAALATKNNLKVGSTFTAYGQPITVMGIFSSGNTFSDNMVVIPLGTLQALSAQPNDITSATATVDSVTNLDAATTAIKSQLGSSADVVSSNDQTQQVVAPLQNVQSISLYSLIGAVVAGAIIVLLTMVMIVRERRREIGVLKAIGASNARVVGQFIAEAVTFTTLGAAVGILGGIVAGNPITQLLVTNSANTAAAAPAGFGGAGGFGGRAVFRGLSRNIQDIHAAVGWSIILYGLAAAVLIAVIGSAIAAFSIAKVRPAEVMRGE